MRQPLVHFLIAGALLFGLWRLVGGRGEPDPRAIVVDVGSVVTEATARRGAPPTPAERRALIDRHVEQELLVREARALGLDRSDAIVRRRLAQKMTFLLEGATSANAPTDAELRAYLQAHRDRFRRAGQTTIEHRFFGGANARARATSSTPDRDPPTASDAFARGRRLTGQTDAELDGAFGPGFADRLRSLPIGRWSRALPSSYGWHRVRIEGRKAGRLPDLDEVRAAVTQQLVADRRRTNVRRAVERLRARYQVKIKDDRPPTAPPLRASK